jgi:mono/diheme cytochrome c family protein
MQRSTFLACVAGAILATGAAEAQSLDIGRMEYMAGCSQCHGISGQGDGIMAPYLTVAPPDLTVIRRDNDGVFPAGVLYEIVEGGGSTALHGSREMPAWGDRYSTQAYLLLGWPHAPEDREAFIRSRILALVEYIAGLQVE